MRMRGQIQETLPFICAGAPGGQAPVEAGREVGVIKVTTSDGMTMQAPVYTAADIGVGGLQRRALDGIEELLLGWW